MGARGARRRPDDSRWRCLGGSRQAPGQARRTAGQSRLALRFGGRPARPRARWAVAGPRERAARTPGASPCRPCRPGRVDADARRLCDRCDDREHSRRRRQPRPSGPGRGPCRAVVSWLRHRVLRGVPSPSPGRACAADARSRCCVEHSRHAVRSGGADGPTKRWLGPRPRCPGHPPDGSGVRPGQIRRLHGDDVP